MTGRPISQLRSRTRTELRVSEELKLLALDGEDLANRARVPKELISHYVRADLTSALKAQHKCLKLIEQNGHSASEVWDLAVKLNPWPMWWNVSKRFDEPVFVRMTFHRYKIDNDQFTSKQRAERSHKREILQNISAVSPILAAELKDQKLLMKAGPL